MTHLVHLLKLLIGIATKYFTVLIGYLNLNVEQEVLLEQVMKYSHNWLLILQVLQLKHPVLFYQLLKPAPTVITTSNNTLKQLLQEVHTQQLDTPLHLPILINYLVYLQLFQLQTMNHLMQLPTLLPSPFLVMKITTFIQFFLKMLLKKP